jgi:hypothetical protein
MDAQTIDGLADRGRAAAEVMVEQFTTPRYPSGNPRATGWDNHRWVRYRALPSALPGWWPRTREGAGSSGSILPTRRATSSA